MTRLLRVAAPLLAAVALAAPSTAHAEPKFQSGLYAEGGIGGTLFLGPTADYAAPGPTFTLRLGWGLTRWLAVGAVVSATTHEATVPPPPEQEYFQLYQGGGQARLTIPVGRVALFGEGSIGLAIISTNVLDKVMVTEPDSHIGVAMSGGGGLAYHLQNRHFSLGLGGDYTVYPGFDASQAVTVRAFLRYVK